MKAYPSIPSSRDRTTPLGQPCYGFYKYDGSNLRWEWSKKRGFYKFGTRHRLFGPDEAPYNKAIPIFMETVGPQVEKIVRDEYKGVTDFIVYTEFWGNQSFAGSHVDGDRMNLTLIDVNIHRKGFIPPKDFWKLFQDHEFTAALTYTGNLNQEIIETVRKDVNYLTEGMVFKGVNDRGQIWMVKTKTLAYLARLKEKFQQDWEKYV